MTQNRDWHTYPRTGMPQRRDDAPPAKTSRVPVAVLVLIVIAVGVALWS